MQTRNLCLSKAGLTGLSGAATTFTTAVAITYAILGKMFSKAAVTGGVTPIVDALTGLAISLLANQGTVVVWALDAAGNVVALGGTVKALDQSGNFKEGYPDFPSVPDQYTAFAYSIHKAGATASGTWTFGVSNWNATGLTHTAQDIMLLPGRPQAS